MAAPAPAPQPALRHENLIVNHPDYQRHRLEKLRNCCCIGKVIFAVAGFFGLDGVLRGYIDAHHQREVSRINDLRARQVNRLQPEAEGDQPAAAANKAEVVADKSIKKDTKKEKTAEKEAETSEKKETDKAKKKKTDKAEKKEAEKAEKKEEEKAEVKPKNKKEKKVKIKEPPVDLKISAEEIEEDEIVKEPPKIEKTIKFEESDLSIMLGLPEDLCPWDRQSNDAYPISFPNYRANAAVNFAKQLIVETEEFETEHFYFVTTHKEGNYHYEVKVTDNTTAKNNIIRNRDTGSISVHVDDKLVEIIPRGMN